jgi:hypothetical protein
LEEDGAKNGVADTAEWFRTGEHKAVEGRSLWLGGMLPMCPEGKWETHPVVSGLEPTGS